MESGGLGSGAGPGEEGVASAPAKGGLCHGDRVYVPTPDSHLQFPAFALVTAGSVVVGHGFSSAQNMAACQSP